MSPLEIHTLANKYIVDVGCGEWQTVALSQEGVVYVWDSASGNSSVVEPVMKADLRGKLIKQISCGNFHTVAVDDNGHVYTWGKNSSGQLGRDGDTKVAQKVRIFLFSFP
jgi:alpha-tubulin suppressor-like RCC1 family protein